MMQDLNKRIALSIDPGYDGTKTTVNGVTFTIPHDTVEKRGKEYDSCRDLEDIYQIETAAGTYLLGPGISALIGENDELHERFGKATMQSNNYSYFSTNEFYANTMASIAIGFIKAAEENLCDLNNIDPKNTYYIVELPHSALETSGRVVYEALVKKHHIVISGKISGTYKTYELDFEIPKNKLIIGSQAIACLIGYTTNENGTEIDNLKDCYPVLLNDNGYYTSAKFVISRTHAISGAESKLDYGMMEIHQKVADKINKEYGTSYKGYDMREIFNERDGMITVSHRISKSGNNETYDIKPTLDKVTREVFHAYMNELDEELDSLTKIKLNLFGGGTGEIFYKIFMQEYAEKYSNLKAELVTYEHNGHIVTPRESISMGGYKLLLSQIGAK